MMTSTDHWLAVIQTIRSVALTDLDDTPEGFVTGPSFVRFAATPPASRLWHPGGNDWAFIGIRVREQPSDAVAIALRLALAAVERKVAPVILTPLACSGFERFGLRCERLFGATPAEIDACEQELARFWSLAIVIDAADVARLG